MDAIRVSTESTSHTETLNGSHEFKISGYSLAKGMGIGKYVASDGKSPEDNSMYVSLFIALASEGADVRALFELTLVDQSDTEEMFLHFIYWDELPDIEELMGTDLTWASTLVAQHLLAAADRYALERLRTICESKLCEGISINTVATTLALAEQHHCFQLKAACLKFIALPANLKAVMETDGFDYLKESCPGLLSELLEYVARLSEHSLASSGNRKEFYPDGCDCECDVNGRRVKQRLH